jgi:hypothetical protein
MTDPEIAVTLVGQVKQACDLISSLYKMQFQNLQMIADLMQRNELLERRIEVLERRLNQ